MFRMFQCFEVLSPCYRFVNDLSQDLAMCKSGCDIDDQCINNAMYADVRTKCYWSATYVRCVF